MQPVIPFSDNGAALTAFRDYLVELGLERHVLDLELFGFTILEDLAPLDMVEQMRARILELAGEDIANNQVRSYMPKSKFVSHLLARGRIFEEAIMQEKPLALITYLLGESCNVSSVSANILSEGAPYQPLHSDAAFMPNPLPAHAAVANIMWCLDDFTRAGGATMVVPGSHKEYRHYPAGEMVKHAVPVECPKGSVFVFHGNLWHGGGKRTLPGERIGFLTYFCRMYMRPQEDYFKLIDDEIIARNPPRFAELIGRNNAYADPDRYGPDMAKLATRSVKTQNYLG